MRHNPCPDLAPAYHKPEVSDEPNTAQTHTGQAEIDKAAAGDEAADLTSDLRRKYWVDEPPRLFVLVDAIDDEPGADSARPELDPDDGVAWGMEFPHEAVAYLRNPYTGQRTFSVHRSAKGAHEFYQRWGTLRLVYLPA